MNLYYSLLSFWAKISRRETWLALLQRETWHWFYVRQHIRFVRWRTGKRRPNNLRNYELMPDKSYCCKDCRSEIKGMYVRRPVHYLLPNGHTAGFGQVDQFLEGYCPVCEKKPNKVLGVFVAGELSVAA